MQQCITVAPVVLQSFHPVHKLQSFALVVVTSSKLDGQRVLVVTKLYLTDFVQC